MQYLLLAKLSVGWIIAIVVLVVLIAAMVALYFAGKKMQKKQDEQQAMMEQNKQTVSMLIIDKKKVKLKDAGFPQSVLDQAPKMSKNIKVYVVKAKVGPQIVSFLCDEKIFDTVPVKKEVKAVISGMYILNVKGLHGKNTPVPQKKKGFFKRNLEKLQDAAGAKPIK
ncbi:MAG: hypothetical protein J6A73_02975 [Lachnospiraceae bacterium]|nr:hypothetical protein [Lachnospiraceae bacterium]